MIKSMTGFASLTHEDDRATLGVTLRSVNHRFLDLQVRVPASLADLEPRIRSLLQKRLARGRVELAISVHLRHPAAPTVELNEDFANALAAAIERARERGLVSGTLTPGDLLRHPQPATVRDRPAEAGPAICSGGRRRSPFATGRQRRTRRSKRSWGRALKHRWNRHWRISMGCGGVRANTCAPISMRAGSSSRR